MSAPTAIPEPLNDAATHQGGVREIPTVRQLILVFRRRWRLFAISWFLVLLGAATFTFTTTRLYRPQAILEIRPETPLISSSDSQDPALLASRNLWENYYRTQEAILTSPTLHEEVLKSLPESIRRVYAEKVDPIRSFSLQVDIEKVRSSFILKVGFIDSDPQKAAQVVNSLVSFYLEEANRHLKEMKTGAADLLSREALPAIKQGVDDADRALQQFLAQNSHLDPQEQYAVLLEARKTIAARITQVKLKQIEMRSQRDTLQASLGEGTSGVFNPAFYGTKNLEILIAQQEAAEAELSRELKNLKEEHPTVIELREQIRRLQGKIRVALAGTLQSLGTDLAAAEQEEKADLAEKLRVERDLADVIQKVSQYKKLDAELLAARELYNAYLKKHGETQATSGAVLGSVRVIDHAQVPLQPYRPNIPVNLGLGGALGIMVGIALIFLREQLDDRILSPKEIEAFVGVNVIGVVPKMTPPDKTSRRPLILGDQSSIPEFEAFRNLRTDVSTRLEGVQGGKLICVLSPMSSEGKSTVAANLAKVFAMEGRRVLLFDCDLRRPTVKRELGEATAPGLEEVLSGSIGFEKAIHAGKIPGVDVIGMSRGSTEAAELAGSALFEEILRKSREKYQYVIVDSAPVNLASESALVARYCDAVLMVVRERQTGRSAAQLAVRRLTSMGVTIIGTVLNASDPRGGGYGYGYYGYYYSYYAPDKKSEGQGA